jgi:glycosyltransferase involved in cell wall biosynthesis
MTVSVVMPTWNRPQFIPRSIDSVLAQTAAVNELIIVDDGSDAPTRAVIEAYQAIPRIRVIWRSHCGNPGAGRNAAIREASSRYIAFLDSDDVWYAEKLERQLAALRVRTDCRWSYTASTCIDELDRPVRFPSNSGRRPRPRPLVESLATFDNGLALPTVLAERALLFEAGLFDENVGCYGDYDLWVRMAALSDAAAVPETLAKVRLHGAHFSRGNNYASLSGREKFLGRAIGLVRTPAVRAQLRRMRALDSAQLARLAARAGNAGEAASRIRTSLLNGWSMPRWWLNAVRVHLHLSALRAKQLLAGRR